MTSKLDPGQIAKEVFDDTTSNFKTIPVEGEVTQGTSPWLVKGSPVYISLGDMASCSWDYVSVLSDTNSDSITVSGASAGYNGTFTVMYSDETKTELEQITFV